MSFLSELCWLKSSFSDAGGNNCVEVAAADGRVALRESQRPEQMLMTSRGALGSLIRSLQVGAFQCPAGPAPEDC